jgi:hypothetical protein
MNDFEKKYFQENHETKEKLDKESEKLFKLIANWLIKLNSIELKNKWYIDISPEWIRNKLNILINSIEKSPHISQSTKKALESFKKYFLDPKNLHIIKFLEEKLILNKNKEINESNIDEYFSILKNTILSITDIWKNSTKKDSEFYMNFIEKLSWNKELLNNFPDIKFVITDLLPAISKHLDENTLSKALDNLFNSSKEDILKLLDNKNKLNKEELYKINLHLIHNLSNFLQKINNPEISSILFEKITKLQIINKVTFLKDIIATLNESRLDKNTKYQTINFLLRLINQLSTPNITNQQIKQATLETLKFLQNLVDKIPDKQLKKLTKIVINFFEKYKSKSNKNSSFKIKWLELLKDINKHHLERDTIMLFLKILQQMLINKIKNKKTDASDYLYLALKNKILDKLYKKVGWDLVEEFKKITSIDLQKLTLSLRSEILNKNIHSINNLKKILDNKIEWKAAKELANNFVDELIINFKQKLQEELTKWDKKLTKKEIIKLLKDSSLNIINHKPELLKNFLNEIWFYINEKDIKLLQNLAQNIINHPKFDKIADLFITNITNILTAKDDIISSFKEILKDIEKKATYKTFFQQKEKNKIVLNKDLANIIIDHIYSKNFNESTANGLINLLEKNWILPKEILSKIDSTKISKLLIIIRDHLPKKAAKNILEEIDFNNLSQKEIYKLVLNMYKNIEDKTDFINKILDLNLLNIKNKNDIDSEKNKNKKLNKEQIEFLTEIIYNTINNSNEISLEETIENIFKKTGYDKLNKIKIFNLDISYLLIKFIKSTPKENFKKLLEYFNEHILPKNKINTNDIVNIIDKILKLTNTDKFINQLKEENEIPKESLFIFKNFNKIKSLFLENEEKIKYTINNFDKAINIIKTLKINNDNEKKFIENYSAHIFDILHNITSNFSIKEFKELIKIIENKNKIIKWLTFSDNLWKKQNNKFELSENIKSKLINNFITHNFWFSIGLVFDFLKNWFKLDKSEVLYSYFKDPWHRKDFINTIKDSLENKEKENQYTVTEIWENNEKVILPYN